MNLDHRLSSVLHLLLHLMEASEPIPSDRLATALNTNPAVVRRTMAGLREAGIVTSEKGHGGGWRLRADPEKITLLDVYQALGSPRLFAVGNRCEAPACLIEQAVNVALNDALREAEALITGQLNTLTLAALSTDFSERIKVYTNSQQENAHAI